VDQLSPDHISVLEDSASFANLSISHIIIFMYFVNCCTYDLFLYLNILLFTLSQFLLKARRTSAPVVWRGQQRLLEGLQQRYTILITNYVPVVFMARFLWFLRGATKNVSYIDFWPGMTSCLCGW